ncbi:MAG: precorrin-6A reductase [Alphaproteobacteria bacterium]|nr:MAG: precorrin-6A reductase [Alphaproteobacteria bacterium]
MSATVLILGGTREACELAARLVRDHPDWRVITALAGRTVAPALPPGEVRVGGFGGADGLAAYLRAERVTRLIDATHPFARTISAHARRAAGSVGVPLEVVSRPPWRRELGDDWTEVATLAEARDAIPAGARVLLAVGSRHLGTFAGRGDVYFVVRMVDPPRERLPFADHELVIGKPGGVEEETALLAAKRITHVVCRNSGGEASYAKIAAARRLGLTVIMIGR